MELASASDVLGTARAEVDFQKNMIFDPVPTCPTGSFTLLEQAEVLKDEGTNVTSTEAAAIYTQSTKDIPLTNQRLSEHQKDTLTTVLAHQTTAIGQRHLEMIRIQAKVNSMVKEMKNLRGVIAGQEAVADSYRAMLAPIRLLPTELLMRIFGFVLPKKVSPRRRSSPLGLTHVCSTWRSAALASSGLWDNLYVDVDYTSTNGHVLPSLIPAWFSRAHPTSPLSFFLKNLEESFNVSRLCTGISSFLGRLSELHIENSDFLYLNELLEISGAQFLLLETLLLSLHVEEEDIPIMVIHAPRLHTATLDIPSTILADPDIFIFPWSQLTTLHLPGGITDRAFNTIIFKCMQLQTASFKISPRGSGLGGPFPLPGRPVTFPHLSDFSVEWDGYSPNLAVMDILAMICLPALYTLRYVRKSQFSPMHFSTPAFRRTVQNIGGLRHLTLECVAISISDLSDLLYACPLLVSLVLHMPHIPELYTLRLLRFGETDSAEDETDNAEGETDTAEDEADTAEDEADTADTAKPRPPFLHLTSFTFVIGPQAGEATAEEFAELVISWIQDSLRKTPLEVVSLEYKCWFFQGTDVKLGKVLLGDARKRLGPWTCTGRDSGGMGPLFDTKMTNIEVEM